MVSTTTAALKLPPLSKQGMAELVAKAKRVGIEPEEYAKRLVEEGLVFQREAEESSFAEIMGPVRKSTGKIDEAEIVQLVERIRRSPRQSGRRKKR